MKGPMAMRWELAEAFVDSKLADVLAEEYGIVVQQFVQMKSVIGIVAENGRHFVWKPVPQSEVHRVLAVHQEVMFLQRAGFRVASPVYSRYGSLVTRLPNGQVGQLLPWLPGQHLNLANRQQRLGAVATLAALHRVTLVPRPREHGQSSGVFHFTRGRFVAKFQLKLDLCRRLWPTLSRTFPQLQPYTLKLFRELANLHQTLIQWEGQVAFCHRDLAPHNLLWGEHDHPFLQKVGWIDFDLADWDDPLGDLVQVMNHTVALVSIGPGDLRQMVETYARNLPLSKQAILVLWRVLYFPDVFVRTVVQWLGHGTPVDGRERVLDAWEAELRRWRVLAQDANLLTAGSLSGEETNWVGPHWELFSKKEHL